MFASSTRATASVLELTVIVSNATVSSDKEILIINWLGDTSPIFFA